MAAAELAALLREGKPVKLDGAVIEGDLDLDGLVYPHRLSLLHTTFLGHVHLTEARFAHTLDLTDCDFRQSVNLFATRVDGQLKLRRARIRGGDRPPVRHNFDQIEVAGRLDTTLLHSEVPLSFRQARVGEIGFDGLQVEGDVDLQIARIAGDLFFQAAEEGRSEVSGSVRMAGIEVGGHVDLCGLRIGGALDLANAEIRGDLLCQPAHGRRPEILDAVSLFGARIGGQVGLRGIRIGREDDPHPARGLNLGSAEIREDLRCSTADGHRAEIYGPVSLAGTRIGGVAHFGGARIGRDLPQGPGGEPACGHILGLHGAEIGRGLRICPDGDFRPEIHGGVFGVSARLSHIALFDRVRIDGDLDLQRIVVNGRMLCGFDEEFYADRPDAPGRDTPGHPEIRGVLDLSGAQVQELVIDGRLFDRPDRPPEPTDPHRRRRERKREFYRRLLHPIELVDDADSRLKLDRARLSKLAVRERIPDRVSADGMTFDDLELPRCADECEYSELLRRTHPFKRSTYLAVESWLRNKGLDEPARRVYQQMSDRDLVTGRSSRIGRWLKWLFLGVAIGYGARPQRLIGLFVLAFALSCWLFAQPGSLVSYSERPAASPDPWPAEAQTAWVTLGVALRCHFPMLLFLGEPNYVPSPNPIPHLGIRYDSYAMLISAISWVMVPLFLAGLTGIVRKRE